MSFVEHYMSSRLVMRDSKSSVLEIAKVMVDWNVSSVAITYEKEQKQNNKKVIGILTERDILLKRYYPRYGNCTFDLFD